MNFDVLANLAIALFIVGLAAVMIYVRSAPKVRTGEESKSEALREK
ncbi:MAG TPA: hypothetical protein VF884_01575 [Nitrososphaeraceae archaeon]